MRDWRNASRGPRLRRCRKTSHSRDCYRLSRRCLRRRTRWMSTDGSGACATARGGSRGPPATTRWGPRSPTVAPRIAHRLDAALLRHVATRSDEAPGTVFIVCDSRGHETTASAESLCISQYLAQHAAVLALLRAYHVRIVGLLAGAGHSAAFFANALQAPRVLALEGARVVAMEPAAIARVTGLDGATLAA